MPDAFQPLSHRNGDSLSAFFRGSLLLVDSTVWLPTAKPLRSADWMNIGSLTGYAKLALLHHFYLIPSRREFATLNVLPQLSFVFHELIPYLRFLNRHRRQAACLSPPGEETIHKISQKKDVLLPPIRAQLTEFDNPFHSLTDFFPTPSAVLSSTFVPMQALAPAEVETADVVLHQTGYRLRHDLARPIMDVFRERGRDAKYNITRGTMASYAQELKSVNCDFDRLLDQYAVSRRSHSLVIYKDDKYQIHYGSGFFSLIVRITPKPNGDSKRVFQGIPLVGTSRYALLSPIPRVAHSIDHFWSDTVGVWSWKEMTTASLNLRRELMKAQCSNAQALLQWVGQ